MKVGPASFVEFILARGKTVIFVGQNYWPYKVRFKGKSLTMLLRNNLCRYKPLSRVHFLRDNETYALCPLTTIKENISVIAEALEYSNIEKVFLLDECSEHVRLLEKPKKIELYHRSDLQWNWDSSFYPAFILKWSDFRLNMAPSEIYVSIDLDVLRPGIVECERSDVTSILTLEDVINAIEEIGKRSRIFAGDICGIYRYHKPTLNVIKTLYEKLREYIEGYDSRYSELDASNSEIMKLDCAYAIINLLDVSNSRIEELNANGDIISILDVSKANIGTLRIINAKIENLDLSDAKIEVFEDYGARIDIRDTSRLKIGRTETF
ncbi:MAG: hypothetical protein QW424_00775 [Candidatus Bathyarchaeia archaeon]